MLEADLDGDRPRRHISDVIAENMRDMPADILASLPSDGASEHDHYLCGWPKKISVGSLCRYFLLDCPNCAGGCRPAR